MACNVFRFLLSVIPALAGVTAFAPLPAQATALLQKSGDPSSMLPWLTLVIVTAGMLVMAAIVWFGVRQITGMQRDHASRIRSDEQNLQQKEKLVLASSFAAELTENKIKCETFITIYTELLRNLREMERRAAYEDTGDFIHQHPPLSRHVYDSNLEKLFLFSTKLANDLTQVYAAIRTEPQYFTLETTMPRAAAIRIVEMVLDDAQKTLEPIDPILAALNVIIRDGTKTAGR